MVAPGNSVSSAGGMAEREDGDVSTRPVGEPEEASHWVETLFPPHFSLRSLMEEAAAGAGGSPPVQRGSRRREIYEAALLRLQRAEERRRKEALLSRITRDDAEEEREKPGDESAGKQNSPAGREQQAAEAGRSSGSRGIWTEPDLEVLRGAAREAEEDRGRLRSRLGKALAELRGEEERGRRTRELLDERERELRAARQEAGRRAMHVEALQTEGRVMAADLQTRAARERDAAEGERRLGERLSEVTRELREVRAENANLARDMERLRAQLEESEAERRAAAEAEPGGVELRLRRELEESKAALREERESHTLSRTALDLLRRHFNSQSRGRTRTKPIDKITHI